MTKPWWTSKDYDGREGDALFLRQVILIQASQIPLLRQSHSHTLLKSLEIYLGFLWNISDSTQDQRYEDGDGSPSAGQGLEEQVGEKIATDLPLHVLNQEYRGPAH